MFFIALKRTIKAGYLSFRRNGWLSAATILVMFMALFVLGGLVLLGALSNSILEALEAKIDITVYFAADAPDDKMLVVKKELETISEIGSVVYVSKEKALEEFRENHKANALIASALEEVGDNPLLASLNIKARDPGSYGVISDFLLKKNYPVVEKINYFENQKVIERLGSILGTVRGSGALVAFFLAFIAVLVAFNTVRLAIYTMREEIGIMRLVGATSWFIRGPFLINGILYGAIAAILTIAFFFPISWLASPKVQLVVQDFNLFQYFMSNLMEFTAIMFFSGITLGTTSSLIAMRRYLKI